MAQPTADTSPPVKSTAKRPAGWLWLFYNEERVRRLSLRGPMSTVSKLPQPGPEILLCAGANIVDAKLWSQWKDQNADRVDDDGATIEGEATRLLKGTIPTDVHRSRRAEMAGQPYVVEGPAIKNLATPLADLEEKDALSVIGHILDENALKRYLQTERRPTVAEKIRLKLEAIRGALEQAAKGF